MSQRPASSATDGRINLEQQRKRAKELLQRLKHGTAPTELALLANPHPTLSDAQWLIARQLGFSSWPKLKAHVEAVDFAANHPGFEASDEARTTHWRCGNDIAHSLGVAGFKGRFRMLSDPLCMGQSRPCLARPTGRCGRASSARRLPWMWQMPHAAWTMSTAILKSWAAPTTACCGAKRMPMTNCS